MTDDEGATGVLRDGYGPGNGVKYRRMGVVRGHRLVLAAGLLAGVYFLFFGLGWLGIIGFTNADSITR